MAKFLDNIGLSRLISKIKVALNSKIDKVTSTDNAVVRFDGTSGNVLNSGVTINDNNQLIPETIGFKPKSRKFNGTGWFRIFSGTISPVHLMLTRNYYSPSPEGYDIDIETFDITVTDDLWGIATITQNAGYFGAGSTGNQEIQKIRVYGYNGAPSTNPDNSDKKKLCIDVYITDRYPSGANTYYISGYSLGPANNFLNYAELTADNIEYVEFCQGKNSTRYYSEFTLVDGFKTNKKAVAQSFVKEGGTSSQFLLGDGSVTTLKTVNSTSLLGSGNVAVQPTLVSGTNIKTINNTSLLGSGNISVQTPLTFDSTPTANSTNPVTSGGIKTALDAKKGIVDIVSSSTPDGTFIVLLDNGDDITVDFNHSHPQYQETLVSGTTIKTINGESLLGSGDIKTTFVVNVTSTTSGGTTTYSADKTFAQIVAAYNAGKNVIVRHLLYDYIIQYINDQDSVYFQCFEADEAKVKILTAHYDDTWYGYNERYQYELTFDNTPTANSNNPVTSKGIKTALDNKVDKVSSTNNAIVRFDGTDGTIQNSSAKVTDNGSISVRDVIIHGSNTSNDTRTISSDTGSNIYFNIGNYIPLVINQTVVRSSIGNNGNIDLGSTSAYWNNVYGKKFITQNGTSSQFVKGDGSLDEYTYLRMSKGILNESPWIVDTELLGIHNDLLTSQIYKTSNDNTLYAADSRFVFTHKVYDATTNEFKRNLTVSPFDDDYEHYQNKVYSGERGELYLGVKSEADITTATTNLMNYFSGYLIVSFYYRPSLGSITGQYYDRNSSTWKNMTFTIKNGTCYASVSSSYGSAFKIVYTRLDLNDEGYISLTQVEFFPGRSPLYERAIVTKYPITQQFYGNIVAPMLVKRGGTATLFLKADGSVDSTSYAPLSSPTFTGTPKAPTASAGTNTTQIATTAFVQSAIDALPEPMIFKGSLGTDGTIISLPVNGTAAVGDTYKVITDGTYAGKAAKAGDTFICLTKTSSANTWELIPSGDEPSGTVTSVGMTVPTGLSVSGAPITSSGTLAISMASGYSIPTTAKQTEWDNKANTASPTFTGTPTAPTATAGTNTTQIATTAFVQTAVNNKVHYVANLLSGNAANYITEPEFKTVKINGSSTNAASSNNCVLLYDTTNACLKFTFN